MKAQARPYMAVVGNGFVRRGGVGLAGPEWCLIPAGEKGKMRVMESGIGARSLCLSVRLFVQWESGVDR